MTPYFLCHHVFKWRAIKSFDTIIFVSWNFKKSCQRKAEFLITMRTKISFDSILFVSTCVDISEIPVKKGWISFHNESNQRFWHHTFLSSCLEILEIAVKKAEFLFTKRAIKSFETILFVYSCLEISEIPVKKSRISYHNESNQKFWLHTFCLFVYS